MKLQQTMGTEMANNANCKCPEKASGEPALDAADDAELDELLNDKPLALTLDDIRTAKTKTDDVKRQGNESKQSCISKPIYSKGDVVWAPYLESVNPKIISYYPAIITNDRQQKKRKRGKPTIAFLPAVDEHWPSRPQMFPVSFDKLYAYGERCKRQLEFEEQQVARPFVLAYDAYMRYLIDAPRPAVSAYDYFSTIHNQGVESSSVSACIHQSSDASAEDTDSEAASESESVSGVEPRSGSSCSDRRAVSDCDVEGKIESDDDSDFGRNGELLVADEPTDPKLLLAFFDNSTIEFARKLIQTQFSYAKTYLASAPLGKRCGLKDLDTLALGCFDEPIITSPAKSVFNSPSLKSLKSELNSQSQSQSQSSDSKTPVSVRNSPRIKMRKALEAEADTTPKSPILTKRKRIQVDNAGHNDPVLSPTNSQSEELVKPSGAVSDADIERDLGNTVYYYFKHVVAETDATRYRKRLSNLRRAVPYPFGTVTNDADKHRIRERYSELAKEVLGENADIYDGYCAQDFVELAVVSQVTQHVLRTTYYYRRSKVMRCIKYGPRYDRRKVRREAFEYGAAILKRAAQKRVAESQVDEDVEETDRESELEEQDSEPDNTLVAGEDFVSTGCADGKFP